MGDDFFSLLFSLFGIAIVLFGCYAFSKYAAKKINTFSNSQNIKILEKVPLSQDKGLALAQICGKYYLIGFSNQSIEILQELSASEMQLEEPGSSAASFVQLFQQARKNGWSVKSFEEFRGITDANKKGRGKDRED
ncbi:MAG: flagellar biosynthetic protein FliO [Clostridium sp.]|uniref:FliO/MopB family protein n=1 Tax=Clostridium sp. TaxID=1506 RepID=UPI0029078F03|nr:flagellar biosynthetic protein FliO [Clostridium sp.]MDU7337001.1 flagellar biosynthetic protein FliO [Clostridium sp.]